VIILNTAHRLELLKRSVSETGYVSAKFKGPMVTGIALPFFYGSYKFDLFVGVEVLTAVVMKSSVFWDTMPRSLLKVNRCFEGTCRHHLQGRRLSQARSQREAGDKQSSGDFLLGLFFDPEYRGDMILRKVG
jgi:hypothetical protein